MKKQKYIVNCSEISNCVFEIETANLPTEVEFDQEMETYARSHPHSLEHFKSASASRFRINKIERIDGIKKRTTIFDGGDGKKIAITLPHNPNQIEKIRHRKI